MKKKLVYCIVLITVLLTLSACRDNPAPSSGTAVNNEETIDNEETADAGESSTFSESDYRKNLCENRTNLEKYQTQYQDDIAQVQKNSYQKLNFDQCNFAELPDSVSVSVLDAGKIGISVEEGISIVKDWLKDIGQEDIDLDKELRVVTQELEWDDSQETPYSYPSVMEHKEELTSGHGFLVNTNSCHALVMEEGICSMSDGTIMGYLGEDGHAELATVGVYQEDIVAAGTFDEMASQSYELLSGKISVREAAEMTKKYFEERTHFPLAKDVELDIPYVSVFFLGDKYGYTFEMRRVYKNIPFTYSYSLKGNSRARSGSEDCTVAYVVNDETVASYYGYDGPQPFQVFVEEKDILSLKDAMELLDSKLASELQAQIEYAGLAYCPIFLDEEENTEVVYPCWALDGFIPRSNKVIRIYMDVLTGEVHLYTDVRSEETDE